MQNIMTQAGANMSQAVLSNQQLQAQLVNQAALAAVPLAQSASLAGINQASMLANALTPFQNYQQQALTNQYNEWLRTRPENSPLLNAGLSFTGQSQMAAMTQQPGAALGGFGGVLGQAAGAVAPDVLSTMGSLGASLLGAIFG
jgi:uncharacterized protein (DUF39 family)